MEARLKENIVRWGQQRAGYRVQPGTVGNELRALQKVMKLALKYGQAYREATQDPDTRDADLARLVARSGLKARVLAAFRGIMTIPTFTDVTLPAPVKRTRILTPKEEQAYFDTAKEVAPVWFQRIATLANVAALDLARHSRNRVSSL